MRISALMTSVAPLMLCTLLTACGSSGSGSTASTDATASSGSTALGAVTGLTITAGNAQNTLTWDELAGATSYTIYFEGGAPSRASALVADCTGEKIDGITETRYEHTSLTNGVAYRYNIVGVGSDGSSGLCGVNATAPEGTPSAPKVYGCNHPDAINYDPTVTDYVPGSCWWPEPTPTPTPAPTPGLTCPIGMVKLTGGIFTMGDDTDANGDNPEHTVILADFCIDKWEVTQMSYGFWAGAGGDLGHPGFGFPGPNNPAEKVDWTHAQSYCAAQGKRLPTEAEWEYAARNGGTAAVNAYATGEVAAPVACIDANFDSCNGAGAPRVVGSYASSASGLYDMAGNVKEWTGDWYEGNYYANNQVNPEGPEAGADRVLRGGSWGGIIDDLRASFRDSRAPTTRRDNIGFRCAKTAPNLGP